MLRTACSNTLVSLLAACSFASFSLLEKFSLLGLSTEFSQITVGISLTIKGSFPTSDLGLVLSIACLIEALAKTPEFNSINFLSLVSDKIPVY